MEQTSIRVTARNIGDCAKSTQRPVRARPQTLIPLISQKKGEIPVFSLLFLQAWVLCSNHKKSAHRHTALATRSTVTMTTPIIVTQAHYTLDAVCKGFSPPETPSSRGSVVNGPTTKAYKI